MIVLFWSLKYLKSHPRVSLHRGILKHEDVVFFLGMIEVSELVRNYPDSVIYDVIRAEDLLWLDLSYVRNPLKK